MRADCHATTNAATHATGTTTTASQNAPRAWGQRRSDSQAKPDRVVNAPQKPTSSSTRRSPVVVASTMPARADPSMFTTVSPHGNCANRARADDAVGDEAVDQVAQRCTHGSTEGDSEPGGDRRHGRPATTRTPRRTASSPATIVAAT